MRKPPRIGPMVSPAPTAAPRMPNALPRSEEGNAAVTMAIPMATIIAAPTDSIRRNRISWVMFCARAHRPRPRVKMMKPAVYRRFRPVTSPARPMVSMSPVPIRK